MDNRWFTFNNKGDVGVHDVSEEEAEQDLEYNRSKYPDEDWQMFDLDQIFRKRMI